MEAIKNKSIKIVFGANPVNITVSYAKELSVNNFRGSGKMFHPKTRRWSKDENNNNTSMSMRDMHTTGRTFGKRIAS
jgi:hypothetical protein